ncbi:MAG: DUF4440 domain-containing protein [Xanthomonadales bacterium]|nr:DUF4440 domain-containing protein [Xanthomonadales bacterium]NIX12272.1 DUF4440 domain-containing protein [Xanthomonadales bacterium]
MRVLIALAMLLTGPAAGADLEDDVRCREIGFSKSVEGSDPDRFASFLDEDARFLGASVLRGPEAITDAWSVFFTPEGPQIKWRPRFVEVLAGGELAMTRGPYRLTTVDDDGGRVESWGTFNSVWRLHPDGEWRIVFDAGSEASDAPSAEVKALLDQDDTCGPGPESP